MKQVSATTVRSLLNEVLGLVAQPSTHPPQSAANRPELAFVDVSEPGQFGEGHPFFSIPVPYSTLETRFPALVPRYQTPVVLTDQGDGVAEMAALSIERLGYTDVSVLEGGAPAWQRAGFTLFKGVNLPSKTFGELLEEARHTPAITPGELVELQKKTDVVIVDGRPGSEFHRMSIPGAVSCPNGELVYRADSLVSDETTTVVVNCAGRTRSILGAQTLIDAGFPNPVLALENGTQGWVLEGFELDRGEQAMPVEPADKSLLVQRRARIIELAKRAGATTVEPDQLIGMLADDHATTYLLDVRDKQEFDAESIPGSLHAPGGQLVQATDEWIGVRGALIVLLDDGGVRAPMCAYWLSQLGHDVYVLEKPLSVTEQVAAGIAGSTHSSASWSPETNSVDVEAAELESTSGQLIDLRPSADYRVAHPEGAVWATRARLSSLELSKDRPVVLIGDKAKTDCAAQDLGLAGYRCLRLQGDVDRWVAAGLSVVETPDTPPDAERIDHLFFTAERHNGDRADSILYLEWEQQLLDQIDEQERTSFRLCT